MNYDASSTVQPVGIPLAPEVQLVIDAAFTKVPLAGTPSDNHPEVQDVAEISVARHFT